MTRPTALLIDHSVAAEAEQLVQAARAAGVPVALATPTSDAAPAAAVDAAVDSARKPSREFFEAACAVLSTPPARCLFVDGDDRSVRGARAAGLYAFRWTGPGDLPYLRAALSL